MATARIYNYDSKKDGWKSSPSEGATVKYTVISGKRTIERDDPLCHYFKDGKSMCGIDELADVRFENNTHAYCAKCLPGCRKFAIESKALETAGDESKNVVDYKAAEKKDHPETAKVSH